VLGGEIADATPCDAGRCFEAVPAQAWTLKAISTPASLADPDDPFSPETVAADPEPEGFGHAATWLRSCHR
jgi:hypothetical protein